MARSRLTKNELLELDDTKDILQVFLIKGLNEGIKFSEFQKYFESKKSLPREFFINRRKINKFTLRNRLKQLVREKILSQETSRSPYYLKEKIYNLPIKNLIKHIIDTCKLNQIFFSTSRFPHMDINDKIPDFITILGLNKNKLSNKYIGEIRERQKNIERELGILWNIKYRHMQEECEDILIRMMSKSEKNLNSVLDEITKKGILLDSKLYDFSIALVDDFHGNIPPKYEVIKKCKDWDFDSEILIDIICEMNKKLIQYYPFDVGFFGYVSLYGFRFPQIDLELKSREKKSGINQFRRTLSVSDSISRDSIKDLKEYFTKKLTYCNKELEKRKELGLTFNEDVERLIKKYKELLKNL